jgi:hypothetical protein
MQRPLLWDVLSDFAHRHLLAVDDLVAEVDGNPVAFGKA